MSLYSFILYAVPASRVILEASVMGDDAFPGRWRRHRELLDFLSHHPFVESSEPDAGGAEFTSSSADVPPFQTCCAVCCAEWVGDSS